MYKASHSVRSIHRHVRARMRLLCGLALLVMLAACQPSAPASLARDSAPTAVPSPAPRVTVVPTQKPSATSSGTLNLVVWVSDEFLPSAPSAGGQALASAVTSFQEKYPSIRVTLQPKKSYGRGGITDLLSATQSALPQALPDIVTLDMRDVPRLAKEGRLQPFDSSFAASIVSDLYPFARQAGQFEGRLYGVPFTADVVQAVYDSQPIKAPPLTWTDLISANVKYAMPLGSESGLISDSFLAQYIALGGRFGEPGGKLALDRTPLRDTLEFYRAGLAQGYIVSDTLSLKNWDDAWRAFTTGRASVADSSVRQYLNQRAQLQHANYAAIPTRDGTLATISRSAGFAIVGGDAARRAAAEKFIDWMLSAENNSAWNRAANRLPVRKSALGAWSSDAAYREFVSALLSVALNRPASASDGSALDTVLQNALLDVLNNNVSPAAAADKAAAALAR